MKPWNEGRVPNGVQNRISRNSRQNQGQQRTEGNTGKHGIREVKGTVSQKRRSDPQCQMPPRDHER